MQVTYELGGALGDATIRAGTNVLVAGPPMTGKRQLARDVLARGARNDDGAIVVSTRDSAERISTLFEEAHDGVDGDLIGIVDCVTAYVGKSPVESEQIRYASSPTDMTGIGVEFSHCIDHLHSEREREHTRVLLDSVTVLLKYSGVKPVVRFLRAVTGRIEAVGGIGLFVVESTVHEPETMASIRDLFDVVVERRIDGTITTETTGENGQPWLAEP